QAVVGAEVRVLVQHGAPPRLHKLGLGEECRATRWAFVRATRYGFMVVEDRVRRPDVPQTGLAQLQTEVDVVERHPEVLGVEPRDLLVLAALDDEAGGGHGRDLVTEGELSGLAERIPGLALVEVPRNSPDPGGHARVLNSTVRIEKHRTDRT